MGERECVNCFWCNLSQWKEAIGASVESEGLCGMDYEILTSLYSKR